ncbi:MAG: nickel-responsive transcriptional regulator NikR [Chromatiaceae bacterium]|nr:MAG: nickel-responsive transcriptional regulator NikR [Chromatiaceae bacterium]
MQRISITLDDPLVEDFEAFLKTHGYTNRSEAMRDLIRARLEREELDRSPDGPCIANLTYIYNHHERELATRLTRSQHHQHDLAVATLHVHLDHDFCMETVVLRGPAARVRAFADAVIAQPGVRHGRLSVMPVRIIAADHPHGDASTGEPHTHVQPIV